MLTDDELAWISEHLRQRVREGDPLTCDELEQLTDWLDALRNRRTILASPRHPLRFTVIMGDRP